MADRTPEHLTVDDVASRQPDMGARRKRWLSILALVLLAAAILWRR